MSCHHGKTRRDLLLSCANGFGALAFAALAADPAYGLLRPGWRDGGPLAPRAPQFRARAKRMIFLYMDGGPSQIDTFDPKPRLELEHGKPIGMKTPDTQFDNVGKVFKSPWAFRRHGECGHPVSELFPHVATCADELLVVRSMTSEFSEHTQANYFLHTGYGQQGRPSIGSWMGYGLGSENRDLPGFVVLNGGLIPPGGLDNFNSGFLPATFQGSVFRSSGEPVANLSRREETGELQRGKLDLLEKLDRHVVARMPGDAVESSIENWELAFRMQSAVPELMDLTGESEATRRLYGLDAEYPHTRTFGTQCLLARRLVERGVRFVELTCPHVGHDRWDQHGNLKKGHEDNCRAVDQGIAGLLKDLRSRGLLEDTLVLWGGEFGRTPMAQGTNGRDHNPFGFTIWMAGGGVKAGSVYGSTDDYGYYAVENKVSMHDLHATILHLFGFDHTQLTFRFNSRDMRLTDVHGEVVHDWIA